MSRVKEREVRKHVEGYKEGRRLMRQGDGADEWFGMSIARENLLALVSLGRNEKGEKVDRAELAECLRTHGLRDEARTVEESRAGEGWDWDAGDKRLLVLGVLVLIAAAVFTIITR